MARDPFIILDQYFHLLKNTYFPLFIGTLRAKQNKILFVTSNREK
jgi:hypothetical protein